MYVGAVAILIIFAVMLTRGGAGSQPAKRQFNTQAGLAAVVTVVMLFILLRVVPFFNYPVQDAAVPVDILTQLGQALVGDFVLPFEVASVLLLAALDRRDLHRARTPQGRGGGLSGMAIPLSWYLIVAAVLFCIGIYGVLARRNAVGILMGVELMLNAVNINLVAFWRYLNPTDVTGQAFALFVLVVAAAEAVVGLALIISVYRNRTDIDAENINLLKQ